MPPLNSAMAHSDDANRQAAENLLQAFRRFDVNNDGQISREELATVLRRLDSSWDDAAINQLLRAADSNGDGVLQYEEFIYWALSDGDEWQGTRDHIKGAHWCGANGTVSVTVLGAENLRNADFVGKSDPYCVCEVSGKRSSAKQTQVIHDNLSPIWNCELVIRGFDAHDALEFKVFDRDMYPKSDDFLGSTSLSAAKVLQPGGFSGELTLEDAGRSSSSRPAVLIVRAVAHGVQAGAQVASSPKHGAAASATASSPSHRAAGAANRGPSSPSKRDRQQSAVKELQEMFPGWDTATLEDVLASRGGDLARATETLLQWTVEAGPSEANQPAAVSNRIVRPRLEPVSPWHAARLQSMSEEGHNSSPATSSTRPPLRPLPREEYDHFMAARLTRRCGGYELTTQTVWAAARWKRKMLKPALSSTSMASQPLISPSETERQMHRDLSRLSREEAIVEGRELLRQRLVFLHFRQLEMEDDGNCQFRALSQELYGSQRYHQSVRSRVLQHLRRHEADYGAFFEGGEFQKYISNMTKSGTWGDELTIRAAAEAFGVRVHLVTSTESNWYLVYEAGPGVPLHGEARREVFLTYIAPIHYNVAAPSR